MSEKKETTVTVKSDVSPDQVDSHKRATATQPSVVSWPQESQTLTNRGFKAWCLNIYDSILIIIPLLLILKTVACIRVNISLGKHAAIKDIRWLLLTSVARALIDLNAQLVTLLTVVFVLIVSTASRRYALYKVQRGAYVSDLEQLQGSNSMTSTVKMIVSLRKFDETSLSLLLIWSFYYLGSQACKREFESVLSGPLHRMTGYYAAMEPDLWVTDPGGIADGYPQDSAKFTVAFDAALRPGAPLTVNMNTQKLGLDISGYPLIPDMRHGMQPLEIFMPEPGLSMPVLDRTNTYYTGSIGWPLFIDPKELNLPPNTQWQTPQILGSYSIDAAYLQLDCGPAEFGHYEDFPKGTLDTMRVSLNISSASEITDSDLVRPTTVEVWRRWNYNLWLGDKPTLETTNGSLRVVCNITRPQVSVNIACTQVSCLATAVTFQPIDQAVLYKTIFDDAAMADVFFTGLLTTSGVPTYYYPGAAGDSSETDIEKILDPLWNQNGELGYGTQYNESFYSYQITNAFNTYFNTWVRGGYLKTNTPVGDPAYQAVEIRRGAIFNPHYVLSVPWIVFDFLTSSLLLVAAICSLWFRKRTIAPDILGSVSSLTLDTNNPNMSLPPGGTTLSGLDRARHMKNVKIKIGDISQETGEVGKIGVARVYDGVNVGHLQRERKYA